MNTEIHWGSLAMFESFLTNISFALPCVLICYIIFILYSFYSNQTSRSRIAVAISLIFSYPLAFVGARDGFLDLLKIKGTAKSQNTLTVALLSAITFLALIAPDVSFVMAFAGAIFGNSLIYIFPALMFRGAIKKKADATQKQQLESKLAIGSVVAGLSMGLLGAKMAISTLM